MELSTTAETEPLSRILERSGIFLDVAGDNMESVVSEALLRLSLPDNVDSRRVMSAILEREAMAPTVIGEGLAIPHCRHESLSALAGPLVSLNMPVRPLSCWGSHMQVVKAFFLVLCPDATSHLRVLSALSPLIREKGFLELIRQKPPVSEFLAFTRKHEEKSVRK